MAKKKLAEKDSKKLQNVQFHPNNNLPNIWVDGLSVAIRDDGVCMLRFLTSLEDGTFEQTRVVTNKVSLKRFAVALNLAIEKKPAEVKAIDQSNKSQKTINGQKA